MINWAAVHKCGQQTVRRKKSTKGLLYTWYRVLRPPNTTSTMCPAPLFLCPKVDRPNRPDPLDTEESKARDVEWIRVSSRSRTRVFGRRKGDFCVLDTCIDVREESVGNGTVSDPIDGGATESESDSCFVFIGGGAAESESDSCIVFIADERWKRKIYALRDIGGCGSGNKGCGDERDFSLASSSESLLSESEILESTIGSGTTSVTGFVATENHAALKRWHSKTKRRIKKIRLITAFKVILDDMGVSDEGDPRDGRTDANEMKSVGDENERFGGGVIDCWVGGGKRKDFVDQVLTLFTDGSESESCREGYGYCLEKEGEPAVGVDGGVRAEVKTSNWRERYVIVFMKGHVRRCEQRARCWMDGTLLPVAVPNFRISVLGK